MYIISKKKDYYDGVVGTMGIDKTIVYNREIFETENRKNFPDFINKNKRNWKEMKEYPFSSLGLYSFNKEFIDKYSGYSYFIVGFCGKLYVGWKLYSDTFTTTITYDKNLINKILHPRGFTMNTDLSTDIKIIESYDALNVFREYNSPIFIYDSSIERTSVGKYSYGKNERFMVNPLLNDYKFYKLFDSYQAFQEISMFISGVLGNKEKKVIQVSDKNKIEQHGFDYKWSFRKKPKK